MKKIQTGILGTVMSICASTAAFAQNAQGDEIVLPEVTTTAAGSSIFAGKDAVPDFETLLTDPSDASPVLPVLPEVEFQEVQQELENQGTGQQEKTVYAQGTIEAGYPRYFSGDFSVSKATGKNPFSIKFFNQSASGYGHKEVGDAYYDSLTELSGDKTFTTDDLKVNLKIDYSTLNYGLQQKSPAFFDTTVQKLNTNDDVYWELPHHLYLSGAVTGEWFSRYSGILDKNAAVIAQDKDAEVMSFSPSMEFGWKYNGFHLGIDARYEDQFFIRNIDTSVLNPGENGSAVHRGDFNFYFGWQNQIVKIDTEAGIIVGNRIGDRMFQIPFLVSVSGKWDVPSTGRTIHADVSGGMDSFMSKYSELTNSYRFAVLNHLPGETSDWFGKVNVTVPVKDQWTVKGNIEFRKTAFGNGVWEADYSDKGLVTGLYGFTQVDTYLLDSQFEGAWTYDMFTVGAEWKSHWLHVPSSESKFAIGAKLDVNPEDNKWGTVVEILEQLGDNADYMPFINLSGFYRLNNSIKIGAEIDDLIKVFTAQNRTYATTAYSERGGAAKFQLKFNF